LSAKDEDAVAVGVVDAPDAGQSLRSGTQGAGSAPAHDCRDDSAEKGSSLSHFCVSSLT